MKNPSSSPKKRRKLFKVFGWIFGVILFIVIGGFIAFKVSPWPSVLLIRKAFQKEGRAANERLTKYVPQGIAWKLDLQYESSNSKAKLDLYYPEYRGSTSTKYPLIIWVHGGGFVAGDKSELSNYCKILASKGYIVAAVNYSRAPNANYPVPVRQINSAIAFLVKKANEFNIDDSSIIVAGDSGGAHIAAQLANIFTNAEYAGILEIIPSVDSEKLKGVILHCGPYNTSLVNFDSEYGGFLKTVLWSYMGNKDFKNDSKFPHFSVANFVTENFPPTFISVGNKDPLSSHSHEMASKLSLSGVSVDSLFFPDNYSPGLPHEYQFNLDTDAGKIALERTFKFLSDCVKQTKFK